MNQFAPPDHRSPAEIYDARFVPALFRQWGDTIAELSGTAKRQAVLDVACGTGVLAGAALARVGAEGRVVGLDINDDMLAVARRNESGVEWKCAAAESLPFPDETFDRVLSQFGLMFFEDKPKALREALRVLRPGGRLTFAVCGAPDLSPGYAVFTELLHRLFGHDTAQAFRAPFMLGDPATMQTLAAEAGVPNCEVRRLNGVVRFDSIADLVSTERACAWTLGGLLDERQFDLLLTRSHESLAPFVRDQGRIEFTMPAIVMTGEKRS